MAKNKVEVKSKDKDGNEVVVYVVRPDYEAEKASQRYQAKTFKEALDSKSYILRAKLDSYLKEEGFWDDKKQSEMEEILNTLSDNLGKLKKGGIKLSEARKLAIDVRRARAKLNTLMAERRALDANTCEGQAENAKFDYLVANCILNDKQEKVFNSIEEYKNSEEPFAYDAASAFADLYYDLDSDWEAKLPENEFLKKFGFVDDKLRLVNKEGKQVDVEGNELSVEEEKVDAQPFLDDDGNPVE